MKKTKNAKNTKRCIAWLLAVLVLGTVACFTAFAAGEEAEPAAAVAAAEEEETGVLDTTVGKAVAAAACVGLVAAVGAVSMGVVISKTADSTARQPEAADKISSNMMLGLVFIETVIIYALIVAILIIFVL